MKFWVTVLAALLAIPAVARAADDNDDGIGPLVEVLGQVDDAAFHLDILKGINEALKGRRDVKMPASWKKVYPKLQKSSDPKVREAALNLALVFGDDSAMASLIKTARDGKASAAVRKNALQSLINAKAKDLAPILHELLKDRALRSESLRALAMYDHPKNGDVIVSLYNSLSLNERRSALNTLASRVPTGKQLIAAINDKRIPRSDVPADTIRQLRLLKDKSIDQSVKSIWGEVRDTPAAKKQQMDKLKKMLETKTAYKPDLNRGRALYAQTCQQCHTLFGVGGKVGPDITGSNRSNLDYFLQNVVDPNALIGKDYQATEVRTDDDQLIVGIIEREDAQTLALKTAGGSVLIAKDEIETRKLSEKSMMPEGLINHLTDDQLRDFVAYLANNAQVAMLATQTNAWGLFNGQNLSNWQGDEKVWSVKDGVIVGDATKAKKAVTLISDYTAEYFDLTMTVTITPPLAKNGALQSRLIIRAESDVDLDETGVRIGWNGNRGYITTPDSGVGVFKKSAEDTIHIQVRSMGKVIEIRDGKSGKLMVNKLVDKFPIRGRIALRLEPGSIMKIKDLELKLLSK